MSARRKPSGWSLATAADASIDAILDEEFDPPPAATWGSLREVEHQVLERLVRSANKAELDHITDRRLRRRPDKIGEDIDRTNRLVDRWARSSRVAGAALRGFRVACRTLAALIADAVAPLRPLAGQTAGVRRHLISEFRSGRLQTLTNYGVLTQGFDAPRSVPSTSRGRRTARTSTSR